MRYKTLLSVSIIHRYYSKGNGKVFCFEPTEDCARQLGRFSILFRTAADGFVLLFPCEQGKKDMPEHPIDEEVVFDFAIKSKDPYLLNYSELPFISPSSRVYRFSNLKKPKTIENGKMALTVLNGKTDSAIEAELVPLEVGSYGGSRLQNRISFGGISLHVSPEVPRGFGFVSKRQIGNREKRYKVPGRMYQIRIDNRSTYWRYHVISRYSGNDMDSLLIKNENRELSEEGKIRFERSDIKVGEEIGENTVLFVSSDRIPMQEKGYQDIVLCRGEKEIPVIQNLPNPDVKSVACEGGTCFSDIFVYI